MKLLLVARIRKLEDGALSKMLLEEQVANGWPGLYMETTTICDILDIPNVYKNNVSNEAIKDAIFSNIQMEIKLELLKSKKMENVKDDDFTKFQPYMMEKSLQQARMSFKVRCQMVETIKGNFKAKYKAEGDEKLKCGYCDSGELPKMDEAKDKSGFEQNRRPG